MSLFVHYCAGDGCSFPLESRQLAQECQRCSWSHGRRVVGPVGLWAVTLITERGNTQGSAQKQQEILAWVREWLPKHGYFHVNNVHCKKHWARAGSVASKPTLVWQTHSRAAAAGRETSLPLIPHKTRAAPGQQEHDPETSCAPQRGHQVTQSPILTAGEDFTGL